MVFVEDGHPPSPVTMYRSSDHGPTWVSEEITLLPDKYGNIPSMQMNESGITLQHGAHKGRLIRPSRFYAEGNDRGVLAESLYERNLHSRWRENRVYQ